MLVRAIIVGAALVVLAAGDGAQAATVSSGPLRIFVSNDYDCSVVNVSTKEINSLVVQVTIDGGAPGSGSVQTCAPLAPNAVCAAVNTAGSTKYRFCTATGAGKAKVRGTFCDTTAGQCLPMQ